MKEVWVVDQGSYSDYGIVGIHETEEGAKAWVDMINGESYYDEAGYHAMDVMTGKPRKTRFFTEMVTLEKIGGEIKESYRNTWSTETIAFGRRQGIMEAKTEPVLGPRGGFHGFRVEVTGENNLRVTKAFNDRVGQAKAELLGLT